VKRILVCCDGTWNRPDQVHDGQVCASNVTKIARGVVPVDSRGIEQSMFYDKGVGTGHFDRIRGEPPPHCASGNTTGQCINNFNNVYEAIRELELCSRYHR
jgi:uncharacterized protein (DUF2235 family)